MEDKSQIINRLEGDINSLSLTKYELRQLCEILEDRSQSAAELQINQLGDDLEGHDNRAALENNIRDAFRLNITIRGDEGKELFGSISDVFESANFPKNVEAVYVNSDFRAKNIYDFTPGNSFELLLDFSKTDPLNLTTQPSNPTPNISEIEVRGSDTTWANGVFNEVMSFIHQRPSSVRLIHRRSIYDVLVWGIGFPFAFWIAYRLSGPIDQFFGDFPSLVSNGAYLYVTVLVVMLFRSLFMYTRWVWPSVELKNNDSGSFPHRAAIGAITFGIVASLLYDVLWTLF